MTALGASRGAQTRTTRQMFSGELSAPLRKFLSTESGSAGVLLAATVAALLWANSPWSESYQGFWTTEAEVRLGSAAVVQNP
jgi:Na+/H+ antiporter NhaA